jgi:hypothetical protein
MLTAGEPESGFEDFSAIELALHNSQLKNKELELQLVEEREKHKQQLHMLSKTSQIDPVTMLQNAMQMYLTLSHPQPEINVDALTKQVDDVVELHKQEHDVEQLRESAKKTMKVISEAIEGHVEYRGSERAELFRAFALASQRCLDSALARMQADLESETVFSNNKMALREQMDRLEIILEDVGYGSQEYVF